MREPAPGALTALLISPDPQLASELRRAALEARAFEIIAELRSYPSPHTLEIRLRQYAPEVVLLDVASDFASAVALIRRGREVRPEVHVIGIHGRNDPEALVMSLRAGASDFLYAPFDAAAQREAALRIRKLRQPEASSELRTGKLLVFASAKPGSGASTLASQTAFALARLTGQRLLLVDLDLPCASVSFYLKLAPSGALWEALAEGARLGHGRWTTLVERVHNLDVLPAPPPAAEAFDPARFHEFCEYLRRLYEWVVVDMPSIFHRLSLLGLSESDKGFLVITPELASLHLARKAVQMLDQLGISRDRFEVVVNRAEQAEGLRLSDMERVINRPVCASFPNDSHALERMLALGEPLGAGTALGRSVEQFAGRLCGAGGGEKKRSGLVLSLLPVLSEST